MFRMPRYVNGLMVFLKTLICALLLLFIVWHKSLA